jgi:hypothetical protein
MHNHRIRLNFYGRPETVTIPTTDEEYTRFLDNVKRLAGGDRGVPAFYLFSATPEVSVIVSVADVQTAHCLKGADGGFPDFLGGQDVAFHLRGRMSPFQLKLPRGGPIADMLLGLTDTLYGEEIPGCVMLADEYSQPLFMRLDEIQFVAFRGRILLDHS